VVARDAPQTKSCREDGPICVVATLQPLPDLLLEHLPASAYDELTQALADPEHVSRAEVLKYWTCQTVWWRQPAFISMCR
jgi:hypothetical protein